MGVMSSLLWTGSSVGENVWQCESWGSDCSGLHPPAPQVLSSGPASPMRGMWKAARLHGKQRDSCSDQATPIVGMAGERADPAVLKFIVDKTVWEPTTVPFPTD